MNCFKLLPLSTLCLLTSLLGCDGSAPTTPAAGTTPTTTPAADPHAHPSHGPHKGDLIELGNEEYHAELVHGESGDVTIYILDSSAAKVVPIDATELTINLTHDGKPEQFKLPAAPDTNDPMGMSSRFTIKDAELAGDLDHEGVTAKVVISIKGKQYTGNIEHHHDEAAHAH